MSTTLARRAPAAALALALTATALGAQQRAPERRTIAGSRVAVFNLVGTVRVAPGTGSDVVVEITRRGADADRLRIETGEVRGRQTLRVVYPSDRVRAPEMGRGSSTTLTVEEDGTFFGGRGSSGRRVRIAGDAGLDAAADVVVRVPKGQNAAVHLAVGKVEVRDVDATLAVDVSAADVTTSGTRGALALDTGSGEVSVADAEGALTLDTGSGDVRLANVRGDVLNVDAGSGAIDGRDLQVRRLLLDLGSGGTRLANVRADEVNIDSGSGDVDVGFAAGVTSMILDSGSGDVTLRLPASFGASLEVDTGSGGVETQIPITVTRRSRTTLVGTIGDGKGRVRIDSGSGEVRLVRN